MYRAANNGNNHFQVEWPTPEPYFLGLGAWEATKVRICFIWSRVK